MSVYSKIPLSVPPMELIVSLFHRAYICTSYSKNDLKSFQFGRICMKGYKRDGYTGFPKKDGRFSKLKIFLIYSLMVRKVK